MCFIMEVSIPIGISLPINIVKRLDSERGDISRSRYLLRMIENMYAGKEDKEKYFALLKVDLINGKTYDETRDRLLFEDLTPTYPNKRLVMETWKPAIKRIPEYIRGVTSHEPI